MRLRTVHGHAKSKRERVKHRCGVDGYIIDPHRADKAYRLLLWFEAYFTRQARNRAERVE